MTEPSFEQALAAAIGEHAGLRPEDARPGVLTGAYREHLDAARERFDARARTVFSLTFEADLRVDTESATAIEELMRWVAVAAARRREFELTELTTRFPELEWEVVERDYDVLYRAHRQQHGDWLHARFSADGRRFASGLIAAEHVDDPQVLEWIAGKLDARLASAPR